MRPRLPVLLSVPALLAVPQPALGATHWGYDPGTASESVACAGPCTLAQARSSNQDLAEVLVDGRGVVTSWSATATGGQVRLRVVGGPGAGAWAAPAAPGAAQPVRLPIRAGQLVGLDLRDGATIGYEPPLIADDADVVHQWSPPPADGASGTGGAIARRGSIALRLTIEGDADGDGLGDETQDPDGGSPPPAGGGTTDPGGGGGPPRPTPGGGPAPGGTTDPGTGSPPAGSGPPPAKPAPKVPRTGPRLTLPKALTASRSGVVSLKLANPYGQALSGTATARVGRRTVGRAKLSLPARGSRTLRLKLAASARRTLQRRGRIALRLRVEARAKGTAKRVSTRAATARRAASGKPSSGGKGTGGAASRGFDGTYRASDGQVLVVRDGTVASFSGSITLYCSGSKRQKLASYSMIGDDPAPKVAADGTFAWEATRGYGFQKLKFDGRIQGDVATGKLVVEDRSPLLGTGRIEFDYCYAGKQWSLRR